MFYNWKRTQSKGLSEKGVGGIVGHKKTDVTEGWRKFFIQTMVNEEYSHDSSQHLNQVKRAGDGASMNSMIQNLPTKSGKLARKEFSAFIKPGD